jgi:hypothetical protein
VILELRSTNRHRNVRRGRPDRRDADRPTAYCFRRTGARPTVEALSPPHLPPRTASPLWSEPTRRSGSASELPAPWHG